MIEDRKSAAQRQFGQQATHYVRSRAHATGHSLDVLVEWAQPGPSHQVLDVGTGTGFTAFAFAPYVACVTAYDPTREMLQEAVQLRKQRRLANLQFVQGVAEHLPFEEDSFDIFACRIAAHHFFSVPQFLAEARRVLRPGGQLVMVDTITPEDPAVDGWHNHVELLRDPSHVRDYRLSEWLRFFSEAGLTVKQTSEAISTHLSFDDWVERSGTPPEVVRELHHLFAAAPPPVAAAFQISPKGGDFEFAWPVLVAQAVKK